MTFSDRFEPAATEAGVGPVLSGKTILLADPDRDAAKHLASSLRGNGHRVLSVRDGSRALEVAVLRAPDLVLYDLGCPLIDAAVFSEILRANPRTASVPVVLMGRDDSGSRRRSGFWETFLQKPFNVDEILGRIERLLERVKTAQQVHKTGAVEGSLEQMGLPDLLQILSLNKRSGILKVSTQSSRTGRGTREGELLLNDGKLTGARLGKTKGEKAFFRCLLWDVGTFSFIPHPTKRSGEAGTSLDALLLEGLRQRDELASIGEQAPSKEDLLALMVEPDQLPDELHPVTAEVIELLDRHRTCGDVLDHAGASDLAVMRAITTLVERGIVRIHGKAASASEGRQLVGAEVAFAVHGRAMTMGGPEEGKLRVIVAAPETAGLEAMAAELSGIDGWTSEPGPKLTEVGFGSLGEIRLTDVVRLVLTALPVGDSMSPLWQAYGANALGALIQHGPGVSPLVRHMLGEGTPVVLIGGHSSSDDYSLNGRERDKNLINASSFVEGLSRLLGLFARANRR